MTRNRLLPAEREPQAAEPEAGPAINFKKSGLPRAVTGSARNGSVLIQTTGNPEGDPLMPAKDACEIRLWSFDS